MLAGMFSAYAIVSALHAVGREGEGRYIDVSMQDAMVAALGPRMGETLQAGVSPGRHGNENPMRVPANTYRTSDGEYVTVIVQHDGFWPGFCRALDVEDLLEDPCFQTARARVANRDAINERVSKIFASRTMAEWEQRLEAERVGFSAVNDYERALADPQVAHRGLIRRVEHPVSGEIRVVGAPWIMSGAQAE
ncbi:MAG: CoA transferase, partial [Nitrospinae bacterium]|nr:CoA transferase [Nitrospinota bacterium]